MAVVGKLHYQKLRNALGRWACLGHLITRCYHGRSP